MTTDKKDGEQIIISYHGFRKTVGMVAILLPIVLLWYAYPLDGNTNMQPSISHFFYTPMRDYFVGTLCVLGLFLASYRGYKPKDGELFTDRRLGFVAGISILFTALVPTTVPVGYGCTELLKCSTQSIIWLHLGSAGLFLLILGIFSYFKFSKSSSSMHNRFYKFMGAIIFVCVGIIGAIFLLDWLEIMSKPSGYWLFWLEAIAVWAFGSSWLIKGEFEIDVMRLKDRLLGK